MAKIGNSNNLPKFGFSTSIAISIVARMVCSTLAINPLLQLIADILVDILDIPAGRALFLNDGSNLVLKHTKGLSEDFVARLRTNEENLGKIAIQQKKAVYIEDVRTDSRTKYITEIEGVVSSFALPLFAKEKPVGAIEFYLKKRFTPTLEQIEVLDTVASLCAMAIENAQLYENLKKSYDTLKETQNQLVQREKAASIGQLIAGIAHELRNPLTSVISYTQLLIESIGQEGPYREELLAIEANAKRCKNLIENLLHYSRPSTLKLEKHSIANILDEVITLIAYEFKAGRFKLVRNYHPEAPEALVDYQQMMQVFVNLIMNAFQAMKDGGQITLTVEPSKKEGFVTVKIADTGCGIKEEHLSRLFEPFFTTKEKGKGTGLGLYIVYGIINKHKGTISVETKLGVGTTFIIELPTKEIC